MAEIEVWLSAENWQQLINHIRGKVSPEIVEKLTEQLSDESTSRREN